MKQEWKEYLVFTKKERIAIIWLMGLVLFLTVLPRFIPDKPLQLSLEAISVDSIYKAERLPTLVPVTKKARPEQASAAEYFHFDPNSISKEEWRKLGLRDKTIVTIGKYLSKGGRFKSPEDLSRIYGLSDQEKAALIPWVRIKSESNKPDKPLPEVRNPENSPFTRSKSKQVSRIIEINRADSSDFESLPGIGPKLATRILLFREKLGGFYHVDQVGETYGLADSSFRKLRRYLICDSTLIQFLNINQVNEKQLSQHPYIRFALAKQIVAYRTQHGAFKSPEELGRLEAISAEQIRRLRPYLKTGPSANE